MSVRSEMINLQYEKNYIAAFKMFACIGKPVMILKEFSLNYYILYVDLCKIVQDIPSRTRNYEFCLFTKFWFSKNKVVVMSLIDTIFICICIFQTMAIWNFHEHRVQTCLSPLLHYIFLILAHSFLWPHLPHRVNDKPVLRVLLLYTLWKCLI